MKKIDKNKAASWPSSEQMDELRGELRKRLVHEELESALRLEAVGHLITALHVDTAGFLRFWLQPLLAAGASLEIALASIAQSRFQSN